MQNGNYWNFRSGVAIIIHNKPAHIHWLSIYHREPMQTYDKMTCDSWCIANNARHRLRCAQGIQADCLRRGHYITIQLAIWTDWFDAACDNTFQAHCRCRWRSLSIWSFDHSINQIEFLFCALGKPFVCFFSGYVVHRWNYAWNFCAMFRRLVKRQCSAHALVSNATTFN